MKLGWRACWGACRAAGAGRCARESAPRLKFGCGRACRTGWRAVGRSAGRFAAMGLCVLGGGARLTRWEARLGSALGDCGRTGVRGATPAGRWACCVGCARLGRCTGRTAVGAAICERDCGKRAFSRRRSAGPRCAGCGPARCRREGSAAGAPACAPRMPVRFTVGCGGTSPKGVTRVGRCIGALAPVFSVCAIDSPGSRCARCCWSSRRRSSPRPSPRGRSPREAHRCWPSPGLAPCCSTWGEAPRC